MLLDPEEPYVVAVHNGEHETSEMLLDPEEPHVVAVYNGEHEIRNQKSCTLSIISSRRDTVQP